MSKRKRKPIMTSRRRVFLTLFYIYIALLLYFLFFSEHYGRNIRSLNYRYNLEPFGEITRYLKHRSSFSNEYFLVNIFGNMLAFAPYGFMLPLIMKKCRNFFVTLIMTASFSLLVETVQLITRVGSFDVDDIILNTIGGAIGYLIYYFVYGRKLKKEEN